MTLYTDDEADVVHQFAWDVHDKGGNGYLSFSAARAVLDRVAPAIAARALREAADAMLPPYNCELRYDGTEDPETARWVGYCADTDSSLRARADEIEKVAWCGECVGNRPIVDEFEDQVGFEEQAREVWVTALDCGHSIEWPLKGRRP